MYGSHGSFAKKPLTPEEELEEKTKALEIKKQMDDFLRLKSGELEVNDKMKFSSLIIQLSPEFYTAFNFRKQLFLEKWKNQDVIENYKDLTTELNFITVFQKRHPKNYALWQHRLWLVEKSNEFEKEASDKEVKIEQPPIYLMEIGLCSKMLELDERNFHVWNYRNWLIKLKNQIGLFDKEIKYCDSKIEMNFSNYSAFHFKDKNLRRFYLRKLKEELELEMEKIENSSKNKEILRFGYPMEIISKEIENLKVALIMEANEQGVWFYLKNIINIYLPAFICFYHIKKENDSVVLHLLFNKEIVGINEDNFEIKNENQENILFDLEMKSHYTKLICLRFSSCDSFELEVKGTKEIFSKDMLEELINEKHKTTNILHEKMKFTLSNSNPLEIIQSEKEFEKEIMTFQNEIFCLLSEIDGLEGYNKHSNYTRLYLQTEQFLFSILRDDDSEVIKLKDEMQGTLKRLISEEKSKVKFFERKLANILSFDSIKMNTKDSELDFQKLTYLLKV